MSTAFWAAAAAADPQPMTGQNLSEIVPGASVQIDTPLGTKLPIKFTANGMMSGEAGALAWFLGSTTDRGRWWVADDKLCHKWFKWFDADVQCLKLKRDGEKLYWSRDDGKTGTATLMAAAPIEQKPYALGHPVSTQSASLVEERPVVGPAPIVTTTQPVGTLKAAGAPPKASAAATPKPLAPVTKTTAPPATKMAAVISPTVTKPTTTLQKTMVAPAAPKTINPRITVATAPPAPATAKPQQPVEIVSFRVSGVHPRDVLNVRQGPSSEAPPVGVIPPFADDVRLAGKCQLEWCPVTHDGISGWVNKYYLREQE